MPSCVPSSVPCLPSPAIPRRSHPKPPATAPSHILSGMRRPCIAAMCSVAHHREGSTKMPFVLLIHSRMCNNRWRNSGGDDLDYQYEEALTLLGQIVAEQNRFERFEELARHMGTRHWKRIVVFADRAVKQRKRQLAVA